MKARELDKKIKVKVENEAKNNAFNIIWEKERAWEKINQLVNGKHSKAIVWYFAMAASVSLVVANTLHFIPDFINATLPYENEQPKISNTLELVELNMTTPSIESKKPLDIEQLKPKAIQNLVAKSELEPNFYIEEQLLQNTPEYKSIYKLPSMGFAISPKFTTSINSNANIGAIIQINKPLPKPIIGINQVGISVEYRNALSIQGIEGVPNIGQSHSLYLNTMFGKDDDWSINVGYNMLKSDSNDYFNAGMKINYLQKLTKEINIGPEIIIDANFKRVIPGITLSFG